MSFSHQQLNDFRAKVLAGEPVGEEELRDSIEFLSNLRAGVASSAPAPKSKKEPAKSKGKAQADAKALLGNLL